VGFESSVPDMGMQGDLPILQDTAAAAVWTAWAVTYRDVVILDRDNRQVTVYNLTVNDLSNPANYDTLKTLLRAARR
jgi:hypothetical protein